MQYIIKGCGNINDISKAIKTLQATFGKGATLSTVAAVTMKAKESYLYNVILNQFGKDGKK